VAFSAERLFGIYGTHVVLENPVPTQPDAEDDYTGVNLLWRGPSGNTMADLDPFNVPRVGFDVFVIQGLSVGGALGYASTSDSEEGGDGFLAESHSSVLFAARVGYAHMFSDRAGIWPRGGFTYHSISWDQGLLGEDTSTNGFALTVEVPFVLSPADHFGILLGPTFDIDLTGTADGDASGERKHKFRSIGLQIGLMGWI
jgi:hypothetical protein